MKVKHGNLTYSITTGGYDDHAVDALRYAYNDIITTMRYSTWSTLGVKKVIFHKPATIVYWVDGDKTVVKCSEDDFFDPEKGLAMAICKKVLGENFKQVFKEFLPEEEIIEIPKLNTDGEKLSVMANSMKYAIDEAVKRLNNRIKLKD